MVVVMRGRGEEFSGFRKELDRDGRGARCCPRGLRVVRGAWGGWGWCPEGDVGDMGVWVLGAWVLGRMTVRAAAAGGVCWNGDWWSACS